MGYFGAALGVVDVERQPKLHVDFGSGKKLGVERCNREIVTEWLLPMLGAHLESADEALKNPVCASWSLPSLLSAASWRSYSLNLLMPEGLAF